MRMKTKRLSRVFADTESGLLAGLDGEQLGELRWSMARYWTRVVSFSPALFSVDSSSSYR